MNHSTTFGFLNDCDQGKNFMREVIEKAINNLLLTDFLDFVADPSKDGEAVIKNGFYTRTFNTGIGAIRVNVPRDRANLYRNQLPPYRHSLDSLCQDILALYRKDMTYSEIREFLQAETGYSFSENTIQKIVHKAYGEYQEFMSQPLEDFPFVFLDGTWLTLKRQYQGQTPSVENECVLVALGITKDGSKRVLGFWIVSAEGANIWEEPLRDLQNRGCKNVKLFITDGLNGMPEAIAKVYPKAKHQRCLIHVERNIMMKARKRDRAAIVEDFKTVYTDTKTKEEANTKLMEFIIRWSKTYPSLKAYLDMPNLFSYLDFPEPIRKSIYTSNIIESFNNKVKSKLRKRVTMNSINNCQFCITQIAKDYNRHARKIRNFDRLRDEELKICGMSR